MAALAELSAALFSFRHRRVCAAHADECVGFEHDTSSGACAWVGGTAVATGGASGVDCYASVPDTVHVASHGVACGGTMTSGSLAALSVWPDGAPDGATAPSAAAGLGLDGCKALCAHNSHQCDAISYVEATAACAYHALQPGESHADVAAATGTTCFRRRRVTYDRVPDYQCGATVPPSSWSDGSSAQSGRTDLTVEQCLRMCDAHADVCLGVVVSSSTGACAWQGGSVFYPYVDEDAVCHIRAAPLPYEVATSRRCGAVPVSAWLDDGSDHPQPGRTDLSVDACRALCDAHSDECTGFEYRPADRACAVVRGGHVPSSDGGEGVDCYSRAGAACAPLLSPSAARYDVRHGWPLPTPPRLANSGVACLAACDGAPGDCAGFCGDDGACCRADAAGSDLASECRPLDATSGALAAASVGCDGDHCCVARQSPPDCYEPCGSAPGACSGGADSFCGAQGACCKRDAVGGDFAAECAGRGCVGYFCCVDVPPTTPPSARVGARALAVSHGGDYAYVSIQAAWDADRDADAATNGYSFYLGDNGTHADADGSPLLGSEGLLTRAKFAGAAAATTGQVIFAPYDSDGIGVFDAATLRLSFVSIDASVSATAAGARLRRLQAITGNARRLSESATVFSSCQLVFSALSGGPGALQLSEVSITDGDGAAVATSTISATNPGGSYTGSEAPSDAVDGSTATKWLDNNAAACPSAACSTLLLAFSPSTTVSAYDLTTANDTPDRDPISWDFQCRVDETGAEWVTLDTQTDLSPPTARYTSYGGFTATPPSPSPPPPTPYSPSAPPTPAAPPISLGTNLFWGAASVATVGQVIFAPSDASIVGVYDPHASAFAFVDVSTTLPNASMPGKYAGAATTGAWPHHAVFAPGNADGVGVYDAERSSFRYIDISATLNGTEKFSGAAATADGTTVVFAPRHARGVGVYDAATSGFSVVDVAYTLGAAGLAASAAAFAGAATASNGQVIFAPDASDAAGVFDPTYSQFRLAPLTGYRTDGGDGVVNGPGDCAVVGYQAVGTDDFAILLLADMVEATTVCATNNAWVAATGALTTSEETACYTQAAGTALKAGAVLAAADFATGSIPTLNVDGDSLVVYAGSSGAPTAFLCALSADSSGFAYSGSSTSETDLPPGLTLGVDAISVLSSPERDNGVYRHDSALVAGTKADLLAAIADASNWEADDDPTALTLALPTSTVTGGATSLFDVASPLERKFSGAAAMANGVVAFAPGNARGVGLYEAATSTFRLADVTARLRASHRGYDGAATAANGAVVFAPYHAHAALVVEPPPFTGLAVLRRDTLVRSPPPVAPPAPPTAPSPLPLPPFAPLPTLGCGGTVTGSTAGVESVVGEAAGDAIVQVCVEADGAFTLDACASSFDTWYAPPTLSLSLISSPLLSSPLIISPIAPPTSSLPSPPISSHLSQAARLLAGGVARFRRAAGRRRAEHAADEQRRARPVQRRHGDRRGLPWLRRLRLRRPRYADGGGADQGRRRAHRGRRGGRRGRRRRRRLLPRRGRGLRYGGGRLLTHDELLVRPRQAAGASTPPYPFRCFFPSL